jgi:hypothetical protein
LIWNNAVCCCAPSFILCLKFDEPTSAIHKEKNSHLILLLSCRRGQNQHCVHIVAPSGVVQGKPIFLKMLCRKLESFKLSSKKRFLLVYTMYEHLIPVPSHGFGLS